MTIYWQLVSTSCDIVPSSPNAVQKIALAAEIAGEKPPYSVCLIQSGGLFNGKTLATCNHFQREKRSSSHCQNENASSGLKLYLCHGLRWPTVDDAFKDWKKRTFSSKQRPFLQTLAVQLADELSAKWFLKGADINCHKHNYKEWPIGFTSCIQTTPHIAPWA